MGSEDGAPVITGQTLLAVDQALCQALKSALSFFAIVPPPLHRWGNGGTGRVSGCDPTGPAPAHHAVIIGTPALT